MWKIYLGKVTSKLSPHTRKQRKKKQHSRDGQRVCGKTKRRVALEEGCGQHLYLAYLHGYDSACRGW